MADKIVNLPSKYPQAILLLERMFLISQESQDIPSLSGGEWLR